MKTKEELLKENKIIHLLIMEYFGGGKKVNVALPDWAESIDQQKVNIIFREMLTGMLLADKKCTWEEAHAKVDKMLTERIKKEDDEGRGKYHTYIPENDYKIPEGEYYINDIVALLRKHKNKPEKIQFIADMLEE